MCPRRTFTFAVFCAACFPLAVIGQAGDEKKPLPKAVGIRMMCFSPDGTHLAVAVGEDNKSGRAGVWDLTSGKPVWIHEQDLGSAGIEYSPDGRTVAIGHYDRTIKLADAKDGRVHRTMHGHTNAVARVVFSPDGKLFASSSTDTTIKLWNPETGELLRTLTFPRNYAFGLVFSPNGERLLASGGPVRIWKTSTGEVELALGDDRGFSTRKAVFTDNHHFLADDTQGAVCLWSVSGGEPILRFRTYPSRMAFSRAAGTLAVSPYREGPTELFHLTAQPPPKELKQRFEALLVKLDDDDYSVREAAGPEVLKLGFAIEPELRRLMKDSPSAELRIRCRRLRDELLSKPRATLDIRGGTVSALAFSRDGRLLATGEHQGTVRLWELSTNKEVASFVPSALKE